MKCEISKIIKLKDAAALHGLPPSRSHLISKRFLVISFFLFYVYFLCFLIVFLFRFFFCARLSLITLAAAAGYSSPAPSPAAAASSSEVRMNVSFSAQAQVSQLKVKLFLLSDKSPSSLLGIRVGRHPKRSPRKRDRNTPFWERLDWTGVITRSAMNDRSVRCWKLETKWGITMKCLWGITRYI